MTDHKYTDEEVIKALECCGTDYCNTCPLATDDIEEIGCDVNIHFIALDLINRQRAEIDDLTRDTIPKLKYGLERANKYGVELEKSLANAKAEAIKEFAENLKQDIKGHRLEMNLNGLKGTHRTDELTYETIIEYIDNLVKEMTEGKPCTEGADCSTCEHCYHDGGYNECATDGWK